VHSVGLNPVQYGNGAWYVFDSWSDGGAVNHDITVPSQSTALNLTANFVKGIGVRFNTSPAGLALSVDGNRNYSSYDFVWSAGTTHKIAAPETQTDAQGHKYRFVSWSNGKPAAYDFKTPDVQDATFITATYQAVGQATVASVPAGMALQVDGASCLTPCSIER